MNKRIAAAGAALLSMPLLAVLPAAAPVWAQQKAAAQKSAGSAGSAAAPAATTAPNACSKDATDKSAAIAACSRLIDGKTLRGEKLAAAYVARGQAYGAQGDVDKALADMNAAVRAQPGNADTLFSRAYYQIQKENYDAALADYTAALRLMPDASTFAGRAAAYYHKGDYDKAFLDIDKAIEFDGNTGDYYYTRGLVQNARGRHHEAARDFESAITFKSPVPDIACQRGVANFYDGEFREAVDDLGTCPKNENYAYMRLWRYIAQARGGNDGADARRELDAKGIMGREWPGPVRAMLLGRMKPDALIAAGTDPDAAKAKQYACEARYYVAQYHLIRSELGPGKQRITEAINLCPAGQDERTAALAELKRLNKK